VVQIAPLQVTTTLIKQIPPVTSSVWDVNILVNTLVLKYSLRSSLFVTDQVRHPYKPPPPKSVILFYSSRVSMGDWTTKGLLTEWWRPTPEFNLFCFLSYDINRRTNLSCLLNLRTATRNKNYRLLRPQYTNLRLCFHSRYLIRLEFGPRTGACYRASGNFQMLVTACRYLAS